MCAFHQHARKKVWLRLHSETRASSTRARDICLLSILVIATLVRLLLAYKTPVIPNTEAIFDDMLFMRHANSWLAGSWMGPYDNNALVKNPGFAIVLGSFRALGLSYQLGLMLVHVVSCVVAAMALRPLVPSRGIRSLLYIGMLFTPTLFTHVYFQRVYRNGIFIPLTLGAYSSLVGLYLRRRESLRSLLPFALAEILYLSLNIAIQESSSWMLPFAVICTVVTIGLDLFEASRGRWEDRGPQEMTWHHAVANSIAIAVPLLSFVLVPWAIKSVNQHWYGSSLMNEKYQGGFARATDDLMSIDAGESNPHIWVSAAAIDKALAVSPTLQSMEEEIRRSWANWGSNVTHSDTTKPGAESPQVPGDLAYWALRDACALHGGYASAEQSEGFWNAVSDELETAFADGRIDRKEGLYIAPTLEPIPWDGVGDWVVLTCKTLRFYLGNGLIREAGLLPLDAELGNMGSLENQLAVRELVGGNTLLCENGQPVWEDDAVRAAGKWVDLSRSLLAGLLLLRKLAICAAVLFAPLLLVRGVRLRDHDCSRSFLIIAGLILSAFVLVFASTWLVAYSAETFGDMEQTARNAFSYCGGYHALLMLCASLVIGRGIQMLVDWYLHADRH